MEAQASSTFPVRLDLLGDGGKVLFTAEFVKEKIVLGRILSADVRIDDPRVSRIHALIEVRGNELTITDLASSHGTFVNDKKVIEAKLKVGDRIRLGFAELIIEKGSGRPTPIAAASADSTFDGEATQVNIDPAPARASDGERRKRTERRKRDAFPDEKRLQDRRDGERRIEQRDGERRSTPTQGPPDSEPERRSGVDRRGDREWERRVGQRRRGDRRVFDITSLERRIADRRSRHGDDDVLPEELETAFELPEHAQELEVTALWGDHILDVSNYVDPVVLTVGESPKSHYVIPSEGIPDEFPLITIEEDGITYLAFTDDMSGTVRARDKIYSLKDLQEEKFVKRYGNYFRLPLRRDDFAKLSIGRINFFVLYVKPAPRIRPAPLFDRDRLLLRTMISSALLFFFMIFGLMFVPEPKPVTIEMIPERFAKIVIKKRPKIPDLVQPKATPQEAGSKSGGGAKAKEPEARASKPAETVPKEKPKEQKSQAKQADKPVSSRSPSAKWWTPRL
ncbi:MAG: FHA domain-containing protein [Bdellovibrionota bacterium]